MCVCIYIHIYMHVYNNAYMLYIRCHLRPRDWSRITNAAEKFLGAVIFSFFLFKHTTCGQETGHESQMRRQSHAARGSLPPAFYTPYL